MAGVGGGQNQVLEKWGEQRCEGKERKSGVRGD